MKAITNILEGILDADLDVNVELIDPVQAPGENVVGYYGAIKGINEQIMSNMLRTELQKVVDAANEYIKTCTTYKMQIPSMYVKNVTAIYPENIYPQLTDWQYKRIEAYRIINDWLAKVVKLPGADKILAPGEITIGTHKHRGIVRFSWVFYDDDPNIDAKFIEKMQRINKRVSVKFSRAEDPIWYLEATVTI